MAENLDRLREWWAELREHWDDPYWRADHPELVAVCIAFATGIIGLLFDVLKALIERSLIADG